jgi:hypothetical protein
MAVREMQLGKGTIAYKGESKEYYDGKRGLWRRYGRAAFVALLTLVGLVFLYASFTMSAVGHVTSFTPGEAAGKGTVGVVLTDGREGSVLVPYSETFVPGDQITVSVLPMGRMVHGNDAEQARYAGIAFLLGAGVMVAWGIRQDRRRGYEGEL